MKAEKMTEAVASQTLGELRVRTSFNPSNDSAIDRIKQQTARIIDYLDEMSNGTEKEIAAEQRRLIEKAQDAYEEAAMWAVKAATFNK